MASTAMESIRLWLALTPKQFEDLNNGKEVQPDEYSKGLDYEKTRLLPLNVLSTSMIGHQKVQRVSLCQRLCLGRGRSDRHRLSSEGRVGSSLEI